MVIVDANLLLFAADEASPVHQPARQWLESALNGDERVGVPWQSIGAFVRIATNPRIFERPLSPMTSWSFIERVLSSPVAWIPPATERTARIFGELVERYGLTGNLVPDGQLAAVALEHGVALCSADTDFARFEELRWRNPLSPS